MRLLLPGAALACVVGCTAQTTPSPTPTPSPASAATTVTVASLPSIGRDLSALRWITGTWRGTGTDQAPFFERYGFADDSTLLVEAFADSTLARVEEVTRFELRNGMLTSVPPAPATPRPAGAPVPRWFARVVTPDSVRFEPLSGVRNRFTWRRGPSPDAWTADLEWPAMGERPARRVRYEMRRWR